MHFCLGKSKKTKQHSGFAFLHILVLCPAEGIQGSKGRALPQNPFSAAFPEEY